MHRTLGGSGTDTSALPNSYTLLLHQGLIERAFLDEIQARRAHLPHEKQAPAPHGNVFRPYEFVTCTTDSSSNAEYPVEATIKQTDTNRVHKVRSKYLLGVDGAKSLVRKAISGGQNGDGEWQGKIKMMGDASDIIWVSRPRSPDHETSPPS